MNDSFIYDVTLKFSYWSDHPRVMRIRELQWALRLLICSQSIDISNQMSEPVSFVHGTLTLLCRVRQGVMLRIGNRAHKLPDHRIRHQQPYSTPFLAPGTQYQVLILGFYKEDFQHEYF
jgi:hypothetical protein